MAKEFEDLLDSLKPQHTSLKDAEKLLTDLGWTRRAAKKEASVWKKGTRTLTLPQPKSTRFLKVTYVSLIKREIRAAHEEEQAQKGQEDQSE